ncbi:MAG: putative Ig domain-containing protein [Nitrospira sp.]|nr:putative Ig domain-containing protein [Nitrospira sp.]
MATEVSTWLNFALQQMAAESYLHGINLQDPAAVIRRLVEGNNNGPMIPIDQFTGKTRFVDLTAVSNISPITGSAQAFVSRYQIVDHHANDATGFSATLMFDTQTNSYTLSFRSTESATATQGGDRERDLLGADAELGFSGFAFGQLAAMENYYQWLKVSGTLSAGAVLNVTGFSLGGHLATVFTELHTAEVNNTYIFNGAGRGHVPGAVPGLAAEENRISDMLTYFRSVLASPDNAMASFSRDNHIYEAASAAHAADPGWDPFDQSTANVYGDARYQWAKAATQALFNPSGLTFLQSPGEVQDQGPFTKITHLYGQATTDDLQFIANSGVHAPAIPVFIEGQPLIAGVPLPSFTESGNTHSITLIVDSLAVQELVQTIDSRYGQASAELLIKASSNAKADTVALLNMSDVAEGDSLEKTVEAFHKLFVGPTTPFQPLPVDSTVGGFGNLAFRNEMYTAIEAIQQAVLAKQTQGIIFTINDLTDPMMSPAAISGIATTNTDQGLAYRYALKELNPFAISANTPQANDALYQVHNAQGQLTVFNPADGTGVLTEQFLADRALFLAEKIALNQRDFSTSSGNIHFADYAAESGADLGLVAYQIETGIDGQADQELLFGSIGLDRLEGRSQDDHLYGGDGVDVLIGNEGNDYLQGDAGSDVLEGGSGFDRLVGGRGSDVLEGGIESDILDGGLDSDILRGGEGLDVYIIRAIDGGDTIEDSDGTGVVEFDGKVLIGGLRDRHDPSNVFHSADGTITYRKSGTDLIVTGSGPLTIRNFNSGKFGIRLTAEETYAETTRTEFLKFDGYVQVDTDPQGAPIVEPVFLPFFDDSDNDTRSTSLIGELVEGELTPEISDDQHTLIYAGGGEDIVIAAGGDDEIHGEGDNDILVGAGGHDRLYGEAGSDFMTGDDGADVTVSGNDYLDGGEDDDVLLGYAGGDILIGGEGEDHLEGDNQESLEIGNYGSDYLDGGVGHDQLYGGGGRDVLIGGIGNDFLLGDTAISQGGKPEAGGADSLDGGSGDDYLDGQFGDDVLVGWLGRDIVNGGDGSDALYGGDGDDTLSGDLRVDESGSNYALQDYRGAGGDDLLFGAEGNDILLGGEGNDRLQGGIGDDSLVGGYNTLIISHSDPLFWTLFTASGNDWLDAGEGNDQLFGGIGDDTFWGGQGNDTLRGGGGDDVLEGGADDDVLYGDYYDPEIGANPFRAAMLALSGHDHLDGGAGNDLLYGGEQADTLMGGMGDDLLDGGEGDDVLNGGDGADVFYSGYGNDVVYAGGGNDRLIDGRGNDTLYGEGGDDELISANEYLDSGTSVLVGGSGNDRYFVDSAADRVVEEADAGVDSVRSLVSYTLPDHVENLRTSGATSIATGNALNNFLFGETVDGKAGNDTLSATRYIFGVGYGNDTITDSPIVNEYGSPSENFHLHGNNIVQFLADVLPQDIRWERSGNDLLLRIDGTEDTLAMPSFYAVAFTQGDYLFSPNVYTPEQRLVSSGGSFYLAPSQIERFEFADGTVWGADFFGGTVIGDHHANLYTFGPGSGRDTILDFDFTSEQAADVLLMAAEVSPGEVIVDRVGDDLVLRIAGTVDQLTVQSHFAALSVRFRLFPTTWNVDAYRIEQVQFVDGTIWDAAAIQNQLTNLTGTEVRDILRGNARPNTIYGLAGNDWLESFDGNDVLSGGADNDILLGGSGDDTYVFNLGDGIDTIEDTATGGEGNRIQFGVGIVQSDLVFIRNESARTLTIQVDSSGDNKLVLTNFNPNRTSGALAVETLAFADGSVATLTHLLGLGGPVNHAPTVADPIADQTVSEGAPLSIQIPADTFVDPDANDELEYSASLSNGTALPAWLMFDSVTRTLSGTPQHEDVGALTIAVTVTDGGNLSATSMFTLTVQNANDAPTLAVPLADQSVTQGSLFSFVVPTNTFVDQDVVHGDTVFYSATRADGSTLPTWLTFNPSSRTFSGTPQGHDIGIVEVRVTATDTGALSVSDVFVLTVAPINGTVGNDSLTGTAGDDVIQGLEGDDVLQGLVGDDRLDGGPGMDAMTGGPGNDTYIVDVVGDAVTEALNQGTDTIQSSITYTLGAHVENVVLTGTAAINGIGNSLDNRLTGNSANNTLNGGVGADMMAGGQGNDTYVVDNVDDVVTELVDEGIDTVQTRFTYTLGAEFENLTLIGSAIINGTGNTMDNILTGNSAANVLTGGAGNDTYVVGLGDTVVEQVNEGIDTIQSAVSWTLGADVENLILTGAGTINGIGNGLNNVLIGNSAANTLDADSGDDTINGGAGADTLIGGYGNDTYVVDNVGDVVIERFGEGTDLVQSNVSYTLAAEIEDLTLIGTGAINATGNSLNNRLAGNRGANVLDGGVGADTLIGGAGNDTYFVDDAGDLVIEVASQGTDTVQSAVTYVIGTDVEHLGLIGLTAIDGTGNSLNNMLTGNSEANILMGLDGHDTLDGGVGADTLVGGLGNDTYVVDDLGDVVRENLNEGTDLVQSTVSYALTANVEHLTLTGITAINGIGNVLNNRLTGNSAANQLIGGAGNDTYVVSVGDVIIENANEGTDSVQSGMSWTLGANLENLTLTGTAASDATGNTLNNTLTGNSAANVLVGGVGNDTLRGGSGNDTYLVNRGDGRDLVVENDDTIGNSDRLQYGGTINPLDLVISRQVNDLRLAVHGSADQVTIRDWYLSPNHHIETVQAGDGALLLSTQVDQLIQAMASFSQQSGLTWDQGIVQRPQDVQAILAASWQ